MEAFPRLAFVDVETTGLDPRVNRIAEIGVVTVDGDRVEQWTTLVNPSTGSTAGSRSGKGGWRPRTDSPLPDDALAAAPRFRQVATELERRLAGRLLVAHNARFDYGFLKAEFERVRTTFEPKVLCSLMLSRKLDVDCAHHDLDSLAERHGLQAGVRHRALPDAMLAWQLWQALHRQHPAPVIAEAVENLVAGPLLPAHLPPELIDKLPEAPGIYVFHDSRDEALLAGKARNLRLRVLNYFRVDGLSAKALAISHRIANITWRPTQGMLGADLQLATLAKGLPAKKRAAARELYSWRLDPHAYPTLGLTSLSDPRALRAEESFGVYESERKARNSLARVAARHRLCHSLAGISDSDRAPCLACGELQTGSQCGRKVDRLKHLTRLYSALRPLRLPSWPYPGPIAIRERSDLHIVDRWQYLGTARHECEIPAVLETRRGELDKDVFLLLAKKLPRLAPDKIVPLTECGRRPGSENTETESFAYE